MEELEGENPLKDKKALIVDDNDTDSLLVKHLLEKI
jgi:hypothetical protein